MENWKPISGYEGIYEVSDLGNVRSVVDRRNSYVGKILRPRIKSGYRVFGLTKDGKTRTHKGSRLAAKAFLSNPNNKPTVNHKNGVKNDDRVDNLEWATVSENTKHAFDTGLAKTRKGEKCTSARLKELGVIVIRGLLNSGAVGKEVALRFGISEMMVSDIRLGKTWAELR